MKRGRPSKYNEKLQEKANKYIELCRLDDELSSIEGLALYINVNTDTVNEWRKVHEEFSATVKEVKSIQKRQLMEKGLKNEWNSTMAIFLLKANHGLIDRQVVQNVDTPENKAEELLKAMEGDN